MQGFGLREIVGLGALAVALVLGFIYLDPASGESRRPVEISLGQTPTPIPTVGPTQVPPTPTPAPVRLTSPGGDWIISYLQPARSGGELVVSQFANGKLDVSHSGTPFFDVKDDDWTLRAETDFKVNAGVSQLPLEYAGRLKVSIDGKVVFEAESTNGPTTAVINFEHKGGSAVVRIDVRDVKGPLRLRLVE